jgi:hypothetical protein
VVALGHEVIAREIDVADVGPVTARERPDVALVGLGESSEHALGLIDKIVREAACPVIVLLHRRRRRRPPPAPQTTTSAFPALAHLALVGDQALTRLSLTRLSLTVLASEFLARPPRARRV